MYLEYHKEKKQVVEIHESEPTTSDGYDYAKSSEYHPGDEFEWTIWVNKVDEENNLINHSAIRNNPQGSRLLKENKELKQKNNDLLLGIAELAEKQSSDKQDTMLALAELAETIGGAD